MNRNKKMISFKIKFMKIFFKFKKLLIKRLKKTKQIIENQMM